jgi:hypothetical protein
LFVPELKEAGLGGGLFAAELLPLAGGDTVNDGQGHADELPDHFGEGAHAADGEVEEVVFGEGFDDLAGEAAVLLPVLEECVWGQDIGFGWHLVPPGGLLSRVYTRLCKRSFRYF